MKLKDDRRVGLVLRELNPENRDSTCEPGRPLYWRPLSSGYTHDLAEAGLYEAGGFLSTEHSREVDAEALLLFEIASLEQRAAVLVGLLERVRGEP